MSPIIQFALEATETTRKNIESMLDTYDESQLNHIPTSFNNNLIWNYCHIVVTQQLILYGLSGIPTLVSLEEINSYRKGTKPESIVTVSQYQDWKSKSHDILQQTREDFKSNKFENYKVYETSYGVTLSNIEEATTFNLAHEGLHFGSCLALRKFI